MAADAVQQLLLSLGIDLSPLQQAAQTIKSTFNDLNVIATAVESAAQQGVRDQGVLLAGVKDTAAAAATAAESAAAAQIESNDALRSSLDALRQQVLQRQLETAEIQRGSAAAAAKTAATESETAVLDKNLATLKLQTAELEKQRREKSEGGGGREGIGGAVGGALGDVAKGALGGSGSLLGSVAGGVVAGAGIVGIIEAAGAALERFVDKLKEVSVESGSLVALENVFRGLAQGAGVNADQLMQRLQVSTEGLVSKLSLLKIATAGLRSPYNLSAQAIEQLTADVTKLAESSGHTAQEGINALVSSMERGRPYMLGMVTGITNLRDSMRDIPPVMNAGQRSTLEWARTLSILHKQAENIGELPPTLEKVVTQMKVASQNLFLSFGEGLNTSGGIANLSASIEQITGNFGKMEGAARSVGTAVGNVFTGIGNAAVFASQHIGEIKLALELATAALLAFTAQAAISRIVALGGAMLEYAVSVNKAKTAQDGLNAASAAFGKTNLIIAGLTLTFYALGKQIEQDSSEVEKMSGQAVTFGDKWHGVLGTISNDFDVIGQKLHSVFGAGIEQAAPGKSWQTFAQGIAGAQAARTGNVADRFLHPQDIIGKAIPGQKLDNSETPQQRAREAAEEKAAEAAAAKEMLEQRKLEIQQEKELDDAAYADGEESFEQHQQKMLAIAAETREASLEQAGEILNATITEIRGQMAAGTKTAKDGYLQMQAAESQYQTQSLAAQLTYQTAAAKIAMDGAKMKRDTVVAAAKAELQSQTETLKAQEQQSNSNVRTGAISPDEYYSERVQQIQSLAEKQIDEANKVYQAGASNAKTLQDRADAINKAIQEASDKLTALQLAQPEVDLQSIQHRFQPQERALSSQLGAEQSQQQYGANVPVTQTLQELISNGGSQLTEYETLLEKMNAQGQQFSDTWWNVYAAMQSTFQQMQKYNEELQKAGDYAQPLAQIFQSLNSVAGLWTSKWAQGFSKSVGGGIKELQDSTKQRQQVQAAFGGGPQFNEDPHMAALQRSADSAGASVQTTVTAFSALNAALGVSVSALAAFASRMNGNLKPENPDISDQVVNGGPDDNTQTVHVNATNPDNVLQTENPDISNLKVSSSTSGQDKFTSFATGIQGAVGALVGFTSAISRSTSALGGAVAGGTGGAGVGNVANGLMSNMGGIMGSLSTFMPAIGAGIGVVVGAIVGQKNAQMENEVSQLSSQYSGIMQSFSENTDNLNLTITRMESLIQQASADEANSKKGGAQFASMISQYNQELDSLTNQQSTLMSQMETQLAIFDTPTGMQSFLTTLNGIIEQYDKFAGAAQNASQLAQANEFLSDSLSQFTTSLQNNYTNDQESAINDALSLNELLSTRSTLMSNLNSQVVGVLEQGVLTRQQTSGQTKGEQIENIESAASQQLSSINQEISLEQYKVSIEQYIFNLATTKIGLETQLLALQEGQASQSMAAIQALQQLINALESGNYNFTTLQQLLNSLGYSGAAGLIPSNTLAPVGSGTSSASAFDNIASSAYQSRANAGYGTYRGQGLT